MAQQPRKPNQRRGSKNQPQNFQQAAPQQNFQQPAPQQNFQQSAPQQQWGAPQGQPPQGYQQFNQEYDNTNRGALFNNNRKQSQRSPHMTGRLNVNGVDYWIKGWWQYPHNGGDAFLSVLVEEQQDPNAQYQQPDTTHQNFQQPAPQQQQWGTPPANYPPNYQQPQGNVSDLPFP